MAESRNRSEKRESSHLRWITPAVLIFAVAAVILRVMPSSQPKQPAPVRVITVSPIVTPIVTPQQPPIAVAPPPVQPAPAPDAAPPTAPTETPVPLASVTPEPSTQAAPALEPAPPVSAPPGPSHPLPSPIEQRLIARMHTFDPNNGGLTREQLARAFPRAAERFEEVDANHDGRVTVDELIAAWSRIATFPPQ